MGHSVQYLLNFLITGKVHDVCKATCGMIASISNTQKKTIAIVNYSVDHRDFLPLRLLFFDFDSIFFFLLSFFMRGSTTRKRPLTPDGRLTRLPTPFLPTT